MREKRPCCRGARPIGVPGGPELAFCTASIASPRMTSMARRSSSSGTAGICATGSAVMPLPPPSCCRRRRAPAWLFRSPSQARAVGERSAKPPLPASGGRQSLPPPRRVCRRASALAYPSLTSREQREAGGETVEEVPTPDGPDLAGAERSRQGDRPQQPLDHAGVVVGNGEEMPAPAVAGEQQGGVGVDAPQHLAQVLFVPGRLPA